MHDLLQTIKQAAVEAVEAGQPSVITYGEVTSTNPLRIRVEQKLELEADFFMLTRAVLDHEVDITVNHTTETRAGGGGDAEFASHNHAYVGRKRITIHNGLHVGERVLLQQVQGGQQWIVWDRVFAHRTGGQWG